MLIKPLANPTMTASGLLHVVEHYKPEMQGTVVAVGPCEHPWKEQAEVLAAKVFDVAQWSTDLDPETAMGLHDASAMLKHLVRDKSLVKVGDNVIFSWAGGQELFVEDGGTEQRLLIMRESDILAVIEE